MARSRFDCRILSGTLRTGLASCGPTDPWDAIKDHTRVLLATEHADSGQKHIVVRVWGDAAPAERLLREERPI